MKRADPFLKERKGRTPLDFAKQKIKDQDWVRQVVHLLEDTMELNKGPWERIKGAFRLE